jgi:uncharacterized protein
MAMISTSLKSTTRPVNPSPLPSVQTGLAWASGLLFLLLGSVILWQQGSHQSLFYGIGFLLGMTLYHARFGFTSAFRQLLTVGQGQGIQAHMVMLSVASILFSIIFATGVTWTGAAPQPNLSPVGTAMIVGAFLFGIGMQLGGACASGTLFHVAGGRSSLLLTLTGFIIGSVLAAWNWDFWQGLPSFGAFSLATSTGWGYGPALVVQLAVCALIYLAVSWISKKRNAPFRKPVPTTRGWKRIIRGSWPLWTAAVLLAVLNSLTLFFSGKPWGITSAFVLWGSKILQATGIDVASWSYWSGANEQALKESVLAHTTSIMDFGIIFGALFSAAISGTFKLQKITPKVAAASLIGGIIMGYGARLAFGCNIGAYFSGIASFSLHGWVWAVFALLGSYVGVKLRPLFTLKNPKPTDQFC